MGYKLHSMRYDGEYKDLKIIYFEDGKDFEVWLKKNHTQTEAIWARFYKRSFSANKKNSGTPTLTWAEAVPILLKYGWIDSQAKGLDEVSYLQKFGPRRKNSLWSKINRDYAEKMIKNHTMSPAGLAAVELARINGNWDRAYSGPATIEMPEDFKKALNENTKALTFYETLSKSNKYAFLFRVTTAKKIETREKRIKTFVEMLEKGETFH